MTDASRHIFDEVALECTDDFVITNVLAVRAPENEFAANLIVSRDRLRVGETESTYMSRQLLEMARSLKKFKLNGRSEVSIASRPAHEISCSWLGAQGPIEQRITIVVVGDRVQRFAVTVPKNKTEALFPRFEKIMATVTLEEPR
jgi:hypothetical protein